MVHLQPHMHGISCLSANSWNFPLTWVGVLHTSFLLGESLLPCRLQDQFRFTLVLPFLVQDAPSPSWKQFQTGPTELCQKASWTGGMLSYDTLRGELEGLTLSLFQSGKHRSPQAPWPPARLRSPRQCWHSAQGGGREADGHQLKPGSHCHHDLPKSETHGALMAVYAVIRKEDVKQEACGTGKRSLLSP